MFPQLATENRNNSKDYTCVEYFYEKASNNFVICRNILPRMRRCSNVSFRSHIGREVAYPAETSSRSCNWYVNETDLFQTSFATSHWYVSKINQYEAS